MKKIEYSSIRQIVRSTYDLQKMRIAMGLRLVAIYRERAGLTAPEKDDEKDDNFAHELMGSLKEAFVRITDYVADEMLKKKGKSDEVHTKLPTITKFQPEGKIETYPDLIMAKMYFDLLKIETELFKYLEKILKEIPIYVDYLSTIPGVGPQMAGVIISEIDISRARYPSSLIKYVGIDVVIVGYYLDEKGVEKTVSGEEVEKFYATNEYDTQMQVNNKHLVYFKMVGRSRQNTSLVTREYTTKNGEVAFRNSITFNPWLKTKLLGVLAPSFLKQTKVYVNGEVTSSLKRVALARTLGFKQDTKSQDSITRQADAFLMSNGHNVNVVMGKYAEVYYGYRNRLENSLHHSEKTPKHKHNMAVRYMIKIFLNDLYKEWRRMDGHEVYAPYEEEKLGIVHGVSKPVNRPAHPLVARYAYETMMLND